MALHPEFPKSPYDVLDPSNRWFPTRETLGEGAAEKLIPPLVAELRRKTKEFRDSGYAGASDTSNSLLRWWFQRDHSIPQTDGPAIPFQYYFAQREAIETVVYLVDVAGVRDKHDLMRFDVRRKTSLKMFKETWRRFVIKMATGSGKTKVMSLALAWSYFHKLYEPDSPLARNFLVIAPNIIVLDRLYKDFQGLRIFHEDPVLPANGFNGRNWRDDFQLTLHRQDEVRSTSAVGNIFLTNIHRVYDNDALPPSAKDKDTRDYFLGAKPTGKTTDSKVELHQIVRDIDELMVINDEAHHVHDEKLAWFKSIEDIHNRLAQKDSKLSMQLDLTATPKHDDGAIFAQTVSDYPLVEAIAQDVVKHPVIPDAASQSKLQEIRTTKFTERYADFLKLGVVEWRKAYQEQIRCNKKSILFVMVDDTRNCDEVAEYLRREFPEFESKDSVLAIHTKRNGEISEASSGKAKEELEKLRKLANEIDNPGNPYKAIVSVMMLKEGWDVRNVTTIVGLRAYTAKSKILPEQTLGRGLRRMYPDPASKVNEYVSVVGTEAFMKFVELIHEEGVELERQKMGEDAVSKHPLIIEIDRNNKEKDIDKLDIEIPALTPRMYREYKNLDKLDVSSLIEAPIKLKQLNANSRRQIAFKYTVPATRDGDEALHHSIFLDTTGIIEHSHVIGYFARMIMKDLRLVSGYDVLYGKIKVFVENYLFEKKVSLKDVNTMHNLSESEAMKSVIDSFKEKINALTIKDREKVRVKDATKLQQTRAFPVNNQRYIKPHKSVFNRIVGDSQFELDFSQYLESCNDVVTHAKNYLAVRFKLDYVSVEGEIRNFHPDFFVKLKDGNLVIVETKGLADMDVPRKMARLKQWCEDVAKAGLSMKPRFVYVDQVGFEKYKPRSFIELLALFKKYQ